ncbi:MAG: hypothetical protein SPL13_04265 [Clostridia bacterium]|nr:hypothetical protein [Clostridia bacterium]
MKRIGSFILAIVFLVVSGGLTALNYGITSQIPNGIAGALTLIVFIPLMIIFLLINAASIFTGTTYSIRAIKSDSKPIMIISIVMLVLFVALLGLNAYFGYAVFANA